MIVQAKSNIGNPTEDCVSGTECNTPHTNITLEATWKAVRTTLDLTIPTAQWTTYNQNIQDIIYNTNTKQEIIEHFML